MSASNETDCIPEMELIELFEPRRAEPQQFREGVERRIEKLRAEKEKADATPVPSWFRRVASMFPGDIFVGAAGGSVAGKVAAAKLLPAALALPVLLFGSALGAFAAGTRSLKRSVAGAAQIHPHRKWSPKGPQFNKDLRIGSMLQRTMAWGFLYGTLVGSWFGGTDVMLVVLLISMGALAFSMRGFASAGLMSRAQVTQLCSYVLYSAFVGSFWFVGLHTLDASSDLGIGWSAAVVLVGAGICFLQQPRTLRVLATVVGVVVLIVLMNPFCWTRSSPDSLRVQLESWQLEPGTSSNWEDAAALHRALQVTGGPLPDLSAVKSRLDRAIESGTVKSWTQWTEPLGMGLIDAEHRSMLCKIPIVAEKLEGVRSGNAPLQDLRYEWYAVALLKEEANVNLALRDRLADQLEAEWPKQGDQGSPADAWLCVRGLDEIGATDRANALREKAYDFLVSHWIAHGRRRGGFARYPDSGRSRDDDTWYAVQLLERFGAPPQIDLRLLRGYLRSESKVMLMDMDAEAKSRASLRVLEDKIGLPERNFLQRIVDERLLIASLLLVALCLTAIRLAPSPEPHEQQGALP